MTSRALNTLLYIKIYFKKYWLEYGLFGFYFLPVAFLLIQARQSEAEVIQIFFDLLFWPTFLDTVGLGLLIAILATAVGSFWGYCLAHYDFWGRKYFLWLLALPLAVPLYIYMFALLSVWQNFYIGERPTALFVIGFAMATSPYAYLISYQAFKKENRDYKQAAQLMGLKPKDYFFKVRWPLVKPFVVISFFIVLSEYLSDFGAAYLFDKQTISTSIYKIWVSYLSFGSATLLSLFSILFILGLLFLQNKFSKSYPYTSQTMTPLKIKYGFLLSSLALIYVLISFFIPVGWLSYLALDSLFLSSSSHFNNASSFNKNFYWLSFLTSISLGALFSVVFVSLCLLLVAALQKRNTPLLAYAQVGYAWPGLIVAVAAVIPFFYLKRFFESSSSTQTSLFLSVSLLISLIALFFAWALRFLKVAVEPLLKEKMLLSSDQEQAALIYKPRFKDRFILIYWPYLKNSMPLAFIFVFVEVVKELPIVLISRPVGWSTLSTQVFEYTSESQWGLASVPALLIVGISSIGLFFALKGFIKNA